MSEFLNLLRANFASRKFSALFQGTALKDEILGTHVLKIETCWRESRSPGFCLLRYSYVTRVTSNSGFAGYGYGESDFKILAIQKSISEAVERCVFKIANSIEPRLLTSNGWAAHLTKAKAHVNASIELLERDSALLHWLTETPMLELEQPEFSMDLVHWQKNELLRAPRFNSLRLLVSTLGEVPIVCSIVHDSNGFGFLSQATGTTISLASIRATAEVCRIADHFTKGILKTPSGLSFGDTPEAHAIHYATHEPIPNWLFGARSSKTQVASIWNQKMNQHKEADLRIEFQDFQCGDIFVSSAKSKNVQNLFFGPTKAAAANGWLNLERIKSITGNERWSIKPHFVP